MIKSNQDNMSLFKKKNLQNRAIELDIIRGVSILLMIFDHFMFDMFGLIPVIFNNFPGENEIVGWLYRTAFKYWDWGVREGVQEFVIFIFFALTGICCSFSKSNLKRGGILLIVALGVSLVTHIFGYVSGFMENAVIFGVLHAMSLSLLIIGLLEKLKTNKYIYLGIGVLAVIIGIFIRQKQVVCYYDDYNYFQALILSIIGLIEIGGDTMPLLFYGGQMFIGVFLGKLLYPQKKSLLKIEYNNNLVTFVGRNSLWVYILHQLLIPVIFGLVFLCMGYKFAI